MEDKKKKYAYWMRPSQVEEMAEMLNEADAKSKSEFVCKALDFYIGYLRQRKNVNYLSPVIYQNIKCEIESVEHNISEMIFKLAVEQAVANNITAASCNADVETLSKMRDYCADEIAQTNGIFTLEKAYDLQE